MLKVYDYDYVNEREVIVHVVDTETLRKFSGQLVEEEE